MKIQCPACYRYFTDPQQYEAHMQGEIACREQKQSEDINRQWQRIHEQEQRSRMKEILEIDSKGGEK